MARQKGTKSLGWDMLLAYSAIPRAMQRCAPWHFSTAAAADEKSVGGEASRGAPAKSRLGMESQVFGLVDASTLEKVPFDGQRSLPLRAS